MFRSTPLETPPEGWWTSPYYIGALALACIIPLLSPTVPPLVDLMGHMGRYAVELADPQSPLRAQYFDFKWALMGNLGVDLLVIPLSKIFGLELAVKLIVMAVPVLTLTGMLLIAQEVHGRLPATAALAAPFAFCWPFQWGFINYVLAMALTLNAFALWLYLARTGRVRLRAILFVPIGALIWLAHGFAWGVLGLLAFAAELVRMRDQGRSVFASLLFGGLHCLPLAPPLVLMALWRSGDVTGATTDWFNWVAKYVYLISSLRNHWMWFDVRNVAGLMLLVAFGLVGLGFRMRRTLGVAALVLIIAYALMPRIVIGSAYADMRLAPYVIAIGVLAIVPRFTNRIALQAVAVLALAIFGYRLYLSTVRYDAFSRHHEAQLKALDHVKPGSRIFVLVDLPCLSLWESPRMEHLGAMAIVRREAFVNGQWTMPGAQLLSIKYAPAKGYAEDPTQVMRPKYCRAWNARSIESSIALFPRQAFDYLWLVDARQDHWPGSDPTLKMVWNGGSRGALYRIVGSATMAMDTPKGMERVVTQ
ncbi:MAG: hypothetical protein JWR77_1007 [Rhizorhabdus sp.]|nr:hypothetical protein [Rhizorhabdus sp.]